MGARFDVVCKNCGTKYEADKGGGFLFHLLHCDKCGKGKSVSFDKLGETHLKFLKGLNIPYCVATAGHDEYIQKHYPGEPIPESEYNRLVEEFVGKCECGGNFTRDAPPRCPNCKSKEIESSVLTYLYD